MSTENGRCYRICKTCGNRWNVSRITKGGGQSYICPPSVSGRRKIKPREGSMRSYNTFANRGRDFEDFVIQVNDLYTRSGKAVVYKVPTEFLPIRDSTGQIKSCKVEHKSCVDFLGRYNSIPVAVETKQTHTGRIDFDAVQPHQAAFLDAWTTDKAVGMILVSFGLRRFFAVPALLAGCQEHMGLHRRERPRKSAHRHRDGLRPDMDARPPHGERSPGRFSSGPGK